LLALVANEHQLGINTQEFAEFGFLVLIDICCKFVKKNYNTMTTLIIDIPNKIDVKFFTDLAKRFGAIAKTLSEEEKEDFVLGRTISSGMKTKTVSKDTILKTLKK